MPNETILIFHHISVVSPGPTLGSARKPIAMPPSKAAQQPSRKTHCEPAAAQGHSRFGDGPCQPDRALAAIMREHARGSEGRASRHQEALKLAAERLSRPIRLNPATRPIGTFRARGRTAFPFVRRRCGRESDEALSLLQPPYRPWPPCPRYAALGRATRSCLRHSGRALRKG